MRIYAVVLASCIGALLGVRSASGGVVAPVKGLPLGTCRDPIAGVWQVRQFSSAHANWHLRTLYIRRGATPSELVGEIETEVWPGGADEQEPKPCTPGYYNYAGTMPDARGTFDDPSFTFGADTWRVDKVGCGTRTHAAGYNPDHFKGTLDRDDEVLRTFDNDGGRSVDEPIVFRRVKCLDPKLPDPPAAPPPPTPPPVAAKSGCGCQ